MLFTDSLKSIFDQLDSKQLFDDAFKSALNLYLSINETTIRIEFNSGYVTTKNVEDEHDPSAYLVRCVTYALNNLGIDQFKHALEVFEQKLDQQLSELAFVSDFNVFVKLAKLFKTLTCDFELKHELKDVFSSFLQKVRGSWDE